jgi:hypothetical protein
MQQFQHALTIPTSTFTNTPFPHLSVRASLSTDNTIGLTMGILTFALGVLTVAFAWALWLLKHREDLRREERIRQQPQVLPPPQQIQPDQQARREQQARRRQRARREQQACRMQ